MYRELRVRTENKVMTYVKTFLFNNREEKLDCLINGYCEENKVEILQVFGLETASTSTRVSVVFRRLS